MEWENLFTSVGWTKFRRIQEARIAEIKEMAWVSFQDETIKKRQLAEIEVIESILAFEADTRKGIAIERGQPEVGMDEVDYAD